MSLAGEGDAVVHELRERVGVDPDHPVHELVALLSTMTARLESIDARLAGLEANTAAVPHLAAELEEFRPLLEMVRKRAERGNFAARFGGKGTS